MNNLLPYAFARDYSVLARSGDDAANHSVEVLVSSATAPAAIAEVSRRFGRIALRRMERSELDAEIASAYAGAGGDASLQALLRRRAHAAHAARSDGRLAHLRVATGPIASSSKWPSAMPSWLLTTNRR